MTLGIGQLVPIDDPEDPRLDDYRDLKDATSRAEREARDAVFVVEGRIAVRQLLKSDFTFRSLLVDDHQVTNASDIVASVRAAGTTVYVASRQTLADTVGFPFHRGVIAVASRRPTIDGALLLQSELAKSDPLGDRTFAVLEGLGDLENIGALFRNAAAFGVSAVLLDPTCADPLYRRSIRVSLGHVLTVPFGRLDPWPGALEGIRTNGLYLVALTPNSSDGSCDPIDLVEVRTRRKGRPLALLLGAEGNGLTSAALAAAEDTVTIPMASGVDSLNVATAAAIAFYACNARPG